MHIFEIIGWVIFGIMSLTLLKHNQYNSPSPNTNTNSQDFNDKSITKLQEFLNTIKDLVSKDTQKAISLIDKKLKKDSIRHHDFILIKANFNDLKNEEINGIISNSEYGIKKNKIIKRFLDLLDLFESEDLNLD